MQSFADPLDASAKVWNPHYARPDHLARYQYEPWLERWQPLLAARPGRALDLGCGDGFDTQHLDALGFEVVALDYAAAAVDCSRARTPRATHLVADTRTLPSLHLGTFHVVVANLSLHYFSKEETEAVFKAIHDSLAPAGLFAFRVNADDEYGAPADPKSWERVAVDGLFKQFFSIEKVTSLLDSRFEIVGLEKTTITRHQRNKSLIEAIALKRS